MLEHLEKLMKTAKFEYTHGHEVDDSSLATGVYYNSKNYTLAVQFHDYPYGTPSAFYGGVPESTYRDLINARSLGVEYNANIKDKFVNLSGGTIYNVTYCDISEPAVESKNADTTGYNYTVNGYVRFSGDFTAKNRQDAMAQFIDMLVDEGYDEDVLAVTEVEIVG
jgi:hypothetical protein